MRALALVLTFASIAAPAAAQDPAQARALFERGVAAMDRGQAAEAAGYFEQSYRLYPRASTACNLAAAQERLGRPCDAHRWYQQCAAIDAEGNARDHALRQAALLAPRCTTPPPAPHDPFVRTPPTTNAQTYGGGGVQVVEGGYVTPQRSVDHVLLGVGIGALVLGAGGIVGGGLSALEAQSAADQIQSPPGPIPAGSADADHYYRAATFSDLALGLYLGGAGIAALGVILVIVDLAQPGALGGGGARQDGPTFVLTPLPSGAFAGLELRL